jgi:hypothetical protein
MNRIVAAALMAPFLLAACARTVEPPQRKPEQAGQPMDPVKVAARIAATRAAAMTGDQRAVQANMQALNEDFRKSIKLADPARRVDRESARAVAKRVDGVRSVAWVDNTNLLAIVSRNDARSYATIDAICMELEPLGDTLGVVVNLQSGAAVSGSELQILSRNCQLAPGDRALLQTKRQLDAVSPEIRAQHRANNPDTREADLAEWKRKNAESMRILEENDKRRQEQANAEE